MNGQNFTQAGRYTFRTNLANSCDSTAYLYLSVLAPSTATITENNRVLSITELPSATYQWQDCNTNTPIAGATQSSFTPSANGVYSVNVYLNSCSSLSSCYTLNTVGITEISKEEIYIYPNPSSSSITLQSSATYLAQPYVLMDMAGRILVNGTIHNESMTIPI